MKFIIFNIIIFIFLKIVEMNVINVQFQKGLTNQTEFENFLDSFMKEYMNSNYLPGCVFTLVKDGYFLFFFF